MSGILPLTITVPVNYEDHAIIDVIDSYALPELVPTTNF
jgi:hypothetical protein